MRRKEAVTMLYRKQCQDVGLAACVKKKAQKGWELLQVFVL